MTGKTGAARIALATGCPGDPGRAVGGPRHPGAVRQAAPTCSRARPIYVTAGDPVDLDDLRAKPLTPEVLREATDRIMDDVTALLEEHPRRAGPRRAVRPARRPASRDRQPARASKPGTGDVHEQGRGVRRRLVGYGVLASCSPTPATTSRCGRGARSSARRSTSKRENTDYLPGHRAARRVSATHDPEQALAGAEVVVLRGAVADVARQNLERVGRHHPARRRAGVPDEGRRARHPQADERGDRRGRRRRPRTRIGVVSGPNLAKEIASREPAASVVACADEEVAERLRALVPLARRSGPTPAPTWSAASSAAPTRT